MLFIGLITDDDHDRDLRSTSYVGFIKPDECPPRQTDVVPVKNGLKKRTCSRKCANDNDCLNDRKLCLCDGACGMSCFRPEKECPELPDPPHGQVCFRFSVFVYSVISPTTLPAQIC
jgi:hypothetical protein